MMRTRHLFVLGLLASLTAMAADRASAVQTVSLGGVAADFQGADGITSATMAAVDGEEIQVLEGGVYNNLDAIGGKAYTIRGMVNGVVISGTPALTFDYTDGAIDITIVNVDLIRDSGTGPTVDLDQHDTLTCSLTLVDLEVRHTLAASGGEALKLDSGGVPGGFVTVEATNCLFEAATASGSGKSALRVQSNSAGPGPFQNFSVTLTTCTLSAQNEGTIRSDGYNNQHWVLQGCTVTAPLDKAFETALPSTAFPATSTGFTGSSFTFTDTVMTAQQEVIGSAHAGLANQVDNHWMINRCTFDNAAGTLGDRTIDIRGATSGTTSTLTMYNSVILSQQGATTNQRAVNADGFIKGVLHHNTLVAAGTGGERGMAFTNAPPYDFSNNVFGKYSDPVSGTTGIKTGNAIGGPNDDTSVGGDRIFTTYAALNLDTAYVPQEPSPLIDAADPSLAISAAIGQVDRNNLDRGPHPAWDIGAFETNPVPVELSAFTLE